MLLDAIMNQLDNRAVDQLGQQIGANRDQTSQAIKMALPMILAGLQRNAQSPQGAQSLDRALAKHDGSILDNLGGFLNQSGSNDGAKILGHIFGSRRNNMEQGVSKVSGLDGGNVSQLMTMLAPMVMGALGKTRNAQGGGLSALTDLLAKEHDNVRQQQPDATGLAGMLLDADGDGDVDFSDLAKRGGSLLGGLLRS